MKLFTIGYTKKSAEEFFTSLQAAGVKRIVDIRVSNNSHLAGFTRVLHFPYLLSAIAKIQFHHVPSLSPTTILRDEFLDGRISWSEYEIQFKALVSHRGALNTYLDEFSSGDCFLCSEPTPEHCHRRLVAELVKKEKPDVQIFHL